MVKTLLITKETKDLESAVAQELKTNNSSKETDMSLEDLEKLIAKNKKEKKQEKVKEE